MTRRQWIITAVVVVIALAVIAYTLVTYNNVSSSVGRDTTMAALLLLR